MIEKLINSICQISELNSDEIDKIRTLVKIKHLKVGDYWFFAGEKTERVAYISKGYLRKYFITDGNEKTDFFYFEDSFTGDLPSIISKQPCKSYNVAMEPTELHTLSYIQLNEFANESKNIERLLRKVTEQGFVMYYNKATSFILQSPKERYLELMKLYPNVLQRATQYHIASYLGITPQHLSRLRASM